MYICAQSTTGEVIGCRNFGAANYDALHVMLTASYLSYLFKPNSPMSTTTNPSYFGAGLLNTGDFYEDSSILHPVVIGSITIIALFAYLRISSNRTTAPLTIWDKIVNVALGSVRLLQLSMDDSRLRRSRALSTGTL